MLVSTDTGARTAHGNIVVLSDDVIAHILGYTQDPATVIILTQVCRYFYNAIVRLGIEVTLGEWNEWGMCHGLTQTTRGQQILRSARTVTYYEPSISQGKPAGCTKAKAQICDELVLRPVEFDIEDMPANLSKRLLKKLDASRLARMSLHASAVAAAGRDVCMRIFTESSATLKSFSYISEGRATQLFGKAQLILPQLIALSQIKLTGVIYDKDFKFERALLASAAGSELTLSVTGRSDSDTRSIAPLLQVSHSNLTSMQLALWKSKYCEHLSHLQDVTITRFRDSSSALPASLVTLNTSLSALYPRGASLCVLDVGALPSLRVIRLSDVRQDSLNWYPYIAYTARRLFALCDGRRIAIEDKHFQPLHMQFVDAQIAKILQYEDPQDAWKNADKFLLNERVRIPGWARYYVG